eukprot:Amastigsp_a342369_6.p4 type:complete len:128 gc:universal Amastigsp_a342369_6:994-611(-)
MAGTKSETRTLARKSNELFPPPPVHSGATKSSEKLRVESTESSEATGPGHCTSTCASRATSWPYERTIDATPRCALHFRFMALTPPCAAATFWNAIAMASESAQSSSPTSTESATRSPAFRGHGSQN